MDWGVYDITTVFDFLQPIRVTIESAWMNRPVTGTDPSPDIVYDIETHFGASLRCVLEDQTVVAVDYGRSSCTHGEERSQLEIEGMHGAIKWDYLPWVKDKHPQCVVMTDKEGRVQEETITFDETSTVGCHVRPLYYFHRRIHGQKPFALVDARATFDFSTILGIVEAAQTGRKITVE